MDFCIPSTYMENYLQSFGKLYVTTFSCFFLGGQNSLFLLFELAYCDNAEPTRKLTNEASPVKINGNGSNCNSE